MTPEHRRERRLLIVATAVDLVSAACGLYLLLTNRKVPVA